MNRIYLSGGVATPPAAPAGAAPQYGTDGEPGVTPASVAGAHWYYQITEELMKVIEGAGLTPSINTYDQLLTAIPIITVRPGMVSFFAMSTAPTGWLKANGSVISRATFARLFTAIGTTFGAGDGSTTFAIPDLRAEFIRAFDDGRGVDTGRVFGSAQTDLVKSHNHNITGEQVMAGTGSRGLNGALISTAYDIVTQSTGGTENRPRNIALLACIKT